MGHRQWSTCLSYTQTDTNTIRLIPQANNQFRRRLRHCYECNPIAHKNNVQWVMKEGRCHVHLTTLLTPLVDVGPSLHHRAHDHWANDLTRIRTEPRHIHKKGCCDSEWLILMRATSYQHQTSPPGQHGNKTRMKTTNLNQQLSHSDRVYWKSRWERIPQS